MQVKEVCWPVARRSACLIAACLCVVALSNKHWAPPEGNELCPRACLRLARVQVKEVCWLVARRSAYLIAACLCAILAHLHRGTLQRTSSEVLALTDCVVLSPDIARVIFDRALYLPMHQLSGAAACLVLSLGLPRMISGQAQAYGWDGASAC